MMIDLGVVVVPRAWALWAPACGYVHGCIGLTEDAARARLADRRANGEAFRGEIVRRVRVAASVNTAAPSASRSGTFAVVGYLWPVARPNR